METANVTKKEIVKQISERIGLALHISMAK